MPFQAFSRAFLKENHREISGLLGNPILFNMFLKGKIIGKCKDLYRKIIGTHSLLFKAFFRESYAF